MLLNIWATFATSFVCMNFQKSPNLITLTTFEPIGKLPYTTLCSSHTILRFCNGPFSTSLYLFSSFQYSLQKNVPIFFLIKFDYFWIVTEDLWCQMRLPSLPLCQIYCPMLGTNSTYGWQMSIPAVLTYIITTSVRVKGPWWPKIHRGQADKPFWYLGR